jgi:RHS repeat-associated protein
MPGRTFNSSATRYGFNGKEKTDEITGVGGAHYDYGFRIYDARIGKFLSVDPIAREYPQLTPFQFASNSPIENIDLDGLEKLTYLIIVDKNNGKHTTVGVTVDNDIKYKRQVIWVKTSQFTPSIPKLIKDYTQCH